jgi:hypothetical protein
LGSDGAAKRNSKFKGQNLEGFERLITLCSTKSIAMKKILAFVALVCFLTACSQYTCPTYSKKEVKKDTPEKRI